MHSYPLIHLITILNKSVMQSRHRRLVLSTPVPAFVLEDFNLCYPSPPLTVPGPQHLWPSCLFHFSHFLSFFCLILSWPRSPLLNSFSFQHHMLIPSKPGLKHEAAFHFHSVLVLLYLFPTRTNWFPFSSIKTISLLASSVFLYSIPWSLQFGKTLNLD